LYAPTCVTREHSGLVHDSGSKWTAGLETDFRYKAL